MWCTCEQVQLGLFPEKHRRCWPVHPLVSVRSDHQLIAPANPDPGFFGEPWRRFLPRRFPKGMVKKNDTPLRREKHRGERGWSVGVVSINSILRCEKKNQNAAMSRFFVLFCSWQLSSRRESAACCLWYKDEMISGTTCGSLQIHLSKC